MAVNVLKLERAKKSLVRNHKLMSYDEAFHTACYIVAITFELAFRMLGDAIIRLITLLAKLFVL